MERLLVWVAAIAMACSALAGTIDVPGEYATIGVALLAASAGDEILVGPGIYAESVVVPDGVRLLSSWGTESEARYGYRTRFLETTIEGSGSGPVVSLGNGAWLEGFTVQGGGLGQPAVSCYGGAFTVIGNRIQNNPGGGLHLVGGGMVRRNLIAGNGGYGLAASYGSPAIYHNTIVENGHDGLVLYYSGAEVKNCILVENGTSAGYGLACTSSPSADVDYNDVWGNGSGDYQGCVAGAHDLSQDPMLADYDDYRLILGTPCINAGVDLGLPEGFYGEEPDLGYEEFTGETVPAEGKMLPLLLMVLSILVVRSVRRRRPAQVVGMAVIFLVAFGSPVGAQDYLAKVSGDEQIAIPGEDLPEPLIVSLQDPILYARTADTFTANGQCNEGGWADYWNYGASNRIYIGHKFGYCYCSNFDNCYAPTSEIEQEADDRQIQYRFHSLLRFDCSSPDPGTVYGGLAVLTAQIYWPESLIRNVWVEEIVESWDEMSVNEVSRPESMRVTDDFNIYVDPGAPWINFPLPADMLSYWFEYPALNYGIHIQAYNANSQPSMYVKFAAGPGQYEPVLVVACENGAPTEGGDVTFACPECTPYPTVTNVDGEASWSGPMPSMADPDVEEELTVSVTCPSAEWGSPVEFTVTLRNPVIHGYLTDSATCSPVTGQQVIIGRTGGPNIITSTDSVGHYTTFGSGIALPSGVYGVIAVPSESGCEAARATVEVSEPIDYRADLMVRCRSIWGRVYDCNGNGIRDATVVITYPGGFEQATLFTDPQGVFFLPLDAGDPDGIYNVLMSKAGYYPPGGELRSAFISANSPSAFVSARLAPVDQFNAPGDEVEIVPDHFGRPGFDPSHDPFMSDNGESVDLFTGKLNLQHVDLHLPGNGGLDLDIIRSYSSAIHYRSEIALAGNYEQRLVPETWLGRGWDLTLGKILDWMGERPVIVMPDGSRHTAYSPDGNLTTWYTKEMWKLVRGETAMTLYLTDGTQYVFPFTNSFIYDGRFDACGPLGVDSLAVSEIRDPSGSNTITVSYSTPPYISAVIDSVGRTVTFNTTTVGPRTLLASIDVGSWHVVDYVVSPVGLALDAPYALESVTFPGAGLVTTFGYNETVESDTYSVLTSLTTPGGTEVTYTHQMQEFWLRTYSAFGMREHSHYEIALIGKSVSGGDVTGGSWTYSIPRWSPDSQWAEVDDAAGNRTRVRFHNYYSPDLAPIAEWRIGLPAVREVNTGENTLEQRTETSYDHRVLVPLVVDEIYPRSFEGVLVPVTLSQTTTVDPGGLLVSAASRADRAARKAGQLVISARGPATSKTTYGYPSSSGDPCTDDFLQPDRESLYGYGSSSTPVRVILREYAWASSSTLRDAHILDPVSEETIRESAGGTLLAETIWDYYTSGPNIGLVHEESRRAVPSPGNLYTSSFTYSDRNVETHTNPASETTTYDWTAGVLSRVETACGLDFSRGIDSTTGWVTSYTDAAGNTTDYDHDGVGRLTLIDPPGGEASTVITYPNARQVEVSKGATNDTVYLYDGLGRLTETQTPIGSSTSHVYRSYDALGRLTFESEPTFGGPGGAGTHYQSLDALGRPGSIADPDGTSNFVYNGDTVTETRTVSGQGRTTTRVYDFEGHLASLTDALGRAWGYEYDRLGQLERVVHPTSGPGSISDRVFERNSLGWLLSQTDPESGTTTYPSYDGAGRVLTVNGPEVDVTIVYDDCGRPTQKTFTQTGPDETVTFHYDDAPPWGGDWPYGAISEPNHLTGVRAVASGGGDPRYVFRPAFDAGGRLLTYRETWGAGAGDYELAYDYDGMGNLASITYPGGTEVSYAYSAATNLLTSVEATSSGGGAPQPLVQITSRSAHGRPVDLAFGNGASETWSPDARGRPEQVALLDSAPSTIYDWGYGYDEAGNLASLDGESRTYDKLDRLLSATVAGMSHGFTYDAWGNMLSMSQGGSSVFNYASYTDNQVPGFAYDGEGRLEDDGTFIYTWSPLGRVASADDSVNPPEDYLYSGLGRRIEKDDGTTVTSYVREAERILVSQTGAALPVFTVYAEGRPVARLTDDGVALDWSIIHPDHLGSPLALTDETGLVEWPGPGGAAVHRYLPYGDDFPDLGTPLIEQWERFTTKTLDDYTGCYDFGARSFDPGRVGLTDTPPRFLSPDVVGGSVGQPQSWNRYAYCLGNPYRFVDPTGCLLRGATEEAQRELDAYESSLATGSQYATDIQHLHGVEDVEFVVNIIPGRGAAGRGGMTYASGPLGGAVVNVDVFQVDPARGWTLRSRLAHELRHAVQFLKGELAFQFLGGNSWVPRWTDRMDEMDAFDAQVAAVRSEGVGLATTGGYPDLHLYSISDVAGKLRLLKRSYPSLPPGPVGASNEPGNIDRSPGNHPATQPYGWWYYVP